MNINCLIYNIEVSGNECTYPTSMGDIEIGIDLYTQYIDIGTVLILPMPMTYAITTRHTYKINIRFTFRYETTRVKVSPSSVEFLSRLRCTRRPRMRLYHNKIFK